MELLKGFDFRPAQLGNPQIDLQCAIADIRDFGRVIRRNAINLGSNVDIGNASVEFDFSEDRLGVYRKLNGFVNTYIIIARCIMEKDAGFIIIGYQDNSGLSFEECIVRVPFDHNRFEFEVTNREEDIEEFRIENLTDEEKLCKAAFIRRVLQKVTQDLP